MPKYKTEVTHDLGQQEALARLKDFSERARSFSDLQGTWSDNTFEFTVSTQGVGMSGTLRVEAETLQFNGKLPLIAMPFVSWIPRVLKKTLSQQIFPAANPTLNASSETVPKSSAPTVLFLHIPKAAGQTLGEFVYNQCREDEEREEGVIKAGVAYLTYGFFKEETGVPHHVSELLKRTNLRAVIGHFQFGLHEHMTRPSTYITVLRNPIDRVASLYYYAKLQNSQSLEEFATRPPFKEVDNDQTRRISGVDPPIGGCTRSMLDQARENLRRHFGVVGTAERFDETLILLKRKLGWNKEIISYPRNVNADRPKTRSLSQEAVDAVRKRNELDFELWEYASELLDEAISGEGPGFKTDLDRYKSSKLFS